MSPSERRMEIIDILCRVRHETAPNLAARFCVSKQTIYNDVIALSRSYPITTMCGRYGGGIVLADWFHLDSKNLAPEQVELLLRLRNGLRGTDLMILNSILVQFGTSRG